MHRSEVVDPATGNLWSPDDSAITSDQPGNVVNLTPVL